MTDYSVSWMGREGGSFLAVGTNNSTVQLWDAAKLRQVKKLKNTQQAVYCILEDDNRKHEKPLSIFKGMVLLDVGQLDFVYTLSEFGRAINT